MVSLRRTPKLSPAGDLPRLGRTPLVPRRRREPPRNVLAWSAGVSFALHVTALALMIITFPNKTPPEPPPTNAVDVVFQPGNKTSAAPAHQGPPAPPRQAAARGRPSPVPQHTVQAAPPPAPLPRPEIKSLVPPHVVTPPKPAPLVPRVPTPVSAAPKPPPALPKINLPPPPPPVPAAPKTPPPPEPVPLPSVLTDNQTAEVNLNMPSMPELAPMNLPPPPPLPPLPPAPQKAAPARRSGHGRSSTFSQGLMMNGMSFNGGSSTGGQTRGLNLNLPSSMQPKSGSDLAIQGDPGTNWMAALEQWVNQRATYPEMAGEMGQQGDVTIRFTVDRTGHVSKLMMVTPTGYALLDQEWLGLFRNADLPPLTPDAKSDHVTVTATMHYQIVR